MVIGICFWGSRDDRAAGRARLVEVLCNPARLLRRYNEAALTGGNRVGNALPLWSNRLFALLRA